MRYRLGSFILNMASRTLTGSDGVPCSLTPRELELLHFLVLHRGEAVRKQDLLDQLWPDTYVEESSLTKAISLVRGRLGQGAITTIPKFGYRFDWPVIEVPPGPETQQCQLTGAANPAQSMSGESIDPVLQAPEAVRSNLVISIPKPKQERWVTQRRIAIAVLAVGVAAGLRIGGHWVLRTDKPGVRAGSPPRLAILPLEPIPDTSVTETSARNWDNALVERFSAEPEFTLKVTAVPAGISPIFSGSGDIEAAATRLGAEYLLVGKILHDKAAITLRPELLRGRDGTVAWAAEYVEPASDTTEEASDGASAQTIRSIVQQVQSSVQEHSAKTSKSPNTVFPQAHEAYLRGRYALSLKTVPDYYDALREFQEATSFDPRYAQAYAGISEAYINLAAGNTTERPMLERARQAAMAAVQLDDELAEAHRDLAYLLPTGEADAEYRRALGLAPNDPRTHGWYAGELASEGRISDALKEAERALNLDPLSLGTRCGYALMLIEAGRGDEAIQQLRQADQAYPGNELVYGYLGLAFARQNKYREAEAMFRHAMLVSTAKVNYEGGYAYSAALAGDSNLAKRLLNDMLTSRREHRWVPAYNIAMTYLALGDRSKALQWLASAAADGSFTAFELGTEPMLNTLRTNPEFQRIGNAVRYPSATTNETSESASLTNEMEQPFVKKNRNSQAGK